MAGSWIYSGLGFCQEVRTEWECGEELRVCAGRDSMDHREGKEGSEEPRVLGQALSQPNMNAAQSCANFLRSPCTSDFLLGSVGLVANLLNLNLWRWVQYLPRK